MIVLKFGTQVYKNSLHCIIDCRDMCNNGVDDGGVCTRLWCAVAWRSETARCHLTDDNRTVQLRDAAAADAAVDSVLCMSSSASVQCGHSVSFHLHHAHNTAAAAAVAAEPLLLSQHDGVGLSVRDNVDIDADDVVFYSFHGNSRHLADDNNKRKETQRCDKSHVCPDHPRCAIPTKVVMQGGVPDVVHHAKFHLDQFRGPEGSKSAIFLCLALWLI